MMEKLYEKCNFSGIWLDMNEPANFCNGECSWYDKNADSPKDEYKHSPFDLPYMPGSPNPMYTDLKYKSMRNIIMFVIRHH